MPVVALFHSLFIAHSESGKKFRIYLAKVLVFPDVQNDGTIIYDMKSLLWPRGSVVERVIPAVDVYPQGHPFKSGRGHSLETIAIFLRRDGGACK